jgi:hypothetical protein
MLNNDVVPNPRFLYRSFARFHQIISTAKSPVVLLEGSRNVPDAIAQRMQSLAAHLMTKFPTLIARSGNAEGSNGLGCTGSGFTRAPREPVVGRTSVLLHIGLAFRLKYFILNNDP